MYATWRSRGIYFLAPRDRLMEVPADATGNTGTPRALFHSGISVNGDVWTRGYSVAPDGRFLVIHEIQADQPVSSRIQVVIGWFSELKRLVPVP
jgi:hypothetical protein